MHGSTTQPTQRSERNARRPVTYWRDAAHFAKRVVWARTRRRLVHRDYLLAYEARHVHEACDYAKLHALANGRSCVLDVGANVGATTLVMAAAAAEQARVIAFEASERSCAIIRENARLNGLRHAISVVNAVVGRQSGCVASFYAQGVSPRGSIVAPPPGESDEIIKPTLALDDFVRQTAIAPDLIKIDVEGAECDVLAGLLGTLATIRPIVFVELHAWPEVSIIENAANLIRLIDSVNYHAVRADTDENAQRPEDFTDLADRQTTSVQSRIHLTLSPAPI